MPQDCCKTVDFGVFLALWNETQNLQTPTIHFRIARWLQKCWESGDRRLILQAFRASGKSTIAGLFIAWLLSAVDPDLRFLILSAEASLSRKMVRNIRRVIENHPLTTHLKPNNPEEWAEDRFTVSRKRVSRDPSVLARGLYANTTGTRADIILCDDVEVPNTCDTADKRERLRERLSENEFILTPGGMQLYIGTPHTYFSLYAKQPRREIGEEEIFLKNYCRLNIPILNKDGVSNWPERYSGEDIETMRLQAGPSKFSSQMMLVPVNILEGRLDPALLRRYDDPLHDQEIQRSLVLSIGGKKIMSASAWWDPSFGKSTGDASVLAVVYTDEHGDHYLHRMEYITVTALDGEDEAGLQCRKVVQVARDLFLPSITIETNGIGKFLPAILRREMNDARVPCTVVERSNNKPKDIRILESFDAVMAARALYVHSSVYDTRFVTEMQEWRPGLSNARDDGLDAAAGAINLEPVRIKKNYGPVKRIWSAQGTHTARTEFDV